MPVDVTEVKRLIECAKDKRDNANILLNNAIEIERKARELCNHPASKKEIDYYSGSYLDNARTTTREYCEVCGKLLDKKVKIHSWHG